jgi:NAD-specific glutamate dehydrogenase
MSKTLYTLLRLFYVQNLNDAYVKTVMDVVNHFPIADATTWVDELIAEINALPILGEAQAQKTAYVTQTLQLQLQAIQASVAAGLPPF